MLRPPIQEDESALLAIRNDFTLQIELMTKPTVHDRTQMLDWVRRRQSESDTFFAVIASVETNQCVGFAQLTHINLVSATADLGIAIASEFQGQGFGRDALENLMKEAYRLGVRDISLNVRSSNVRAQHLYKSMGFNLCLQRPDTLAKDAERFSMDLVGTSQIVQ